MKKYGWKPDLPDHRDIYLLTPVFNGVAPEKVDLRPKCPPVYDQGQLGSCTANAIGAAMQFEMMRQNISSFVPSRLFIYYNERAMEGTVNSDSGAQIRDGIKSVGKLGVCPEVMWPYNIAHFTEKPSPDCYGAALKDRALQYLRLARGLEHFLKCLAAGFPFVFGITVYESFESAAVAKSGRVPLPKTNEQCLGGHAIMAVGYDQTKQVIICRNSWGVNWGKKGYFTLPFSYLLDADLSDDFWTIRLV